MFIFKGVPIFLVFSTVQPTLPRHCLLLQALVVPRFLLGQSTLVAETAEIKAQKAKGKDAAGQVRGVPT